MSNSGSQNDKSHRQSASVTQGNSSSYNSVNSFSSLEEICNEYFLGINEKKYIKVKDHFSIGTETTNHIIFDGKDIAPLHAKIYWNNGLLALMDFGHPQGTYVNSDKVVPGQLTILLPGDTVKIANEKIRILNEIPLFLEAVQVRPKDKPSSTSESEVKKINLANKSSSEDLGQSKIKKLFMYLLTLIYTPILKIRFIQNFLFKTADLLSISLKPGYELAPPRFRLLALLVDWIFIMAIHFMLIEQAFFEDVLSAISQHVDSPLAIFLKKNQLNFSLTCKSIFQTIPLFPLALWSILGTLLLGVSFGQFLFGIRGGHSFFKNRFMGLLRLFIDALLGPFLVFDLPIIWRRPTLKEFMTQSFLVRKISTSKAEVKNKLEEKKEEEEKEEEKKFEELSQEQISKLSRIKKLLYHIRCLIYKTLLKNKFRPLAEQDNKQGNVEELIKIEEEVPTEKIPFLKRWALIIAQKMQKIPALAPLYGLLFKFAQLLEYFHIGQQPPASIWPRIFCFLYDMILAFVLNVYISEVSPVKDIMAGYVHNLHKLLVGLCPEINDILLPSQLESIISIFLTFSVQSLIFNALFACSLSQFILGFKGSKAKRGFIFNRLTGLCRGILGIMTLPFIIFDIPCLFGMRSFKEFLSGNYFILSNKYQKFIGHVLLLPLSVFGILSIPLIQNLDHIQQGISLIPQSDFKSASRTPSSAPGRKRNNSLHLKTLELYFNLSMLKDLVILPHLEDKVGIFPFNVLSKKVVDIYDLQTGLSLLISREDNFSIADAIFRHEELNPLFVTHYPHLSEALHTMHIRDVEAKRKAPRSKNRNRPITYSTQSQIELQKYLTESLTLNLTRLWEFSLKFAPLYHGPLQVKKDILKYLKFERKKPLFIQKMGDTHYLTYLSHKKETQMLLILIPLSFEVRPVLRMHLVQEKKSATTPIVFPHNLFQKTMSEQLPISNDELETARTSVQMIDALFDPQADAQKQEVLKQKLPLLLQTHLQKARDSGNEKAIEYLQIRMRNLEKEMNLNQAEVEAIENLENAESNVENNIEKSGNEEKIENIENTEKSIPR